MGRVGAGVGGGGGTTPLLTSDWTPSATTPLEHPSETSLMN
ncbi:hypothetical protein Tco_0055572, partial [Tanacetum coccineum]